MMAKVVTWETLWTIFAPRTLIVAKPFMGVPQLMQVINPPLSPILSRAKGVPATHPHGLVLGLERQADGQEQVRAPFPAFHGTKDVSELEYYPLNYCANEQEMRAAARARSISFLNCTLFCPHGRHPDVPIQRERLRRGAEVPLERWRW